MSAAPWRQALAAALHRNRRRPDSRYWQLATVRRDGSPAVRTVVFRGFRSDSNDLLLITDQRSNKLGELAQQPRTELCAYLPDTREQFRFSGRMLIHTATDDSAGLRSDLWSRLSEAARQQFTWPRPGADRSPESTFSILAPETPPDCFTVLSLVPERVDHLQLRPSPQQRQQHQLRDGRWETRDINP